jgi:hypothetical protein
MPDLEQLKRFAPPHTTPAPAARAAAREALLRRTRRRRIPRFVLLAPALAAAVAAIVLALPRGDARIDERPATTPTPAKSAIVPSRPLKPGQYLYTRSHGANLTTVADAPGYAALIAYDDETWLGLDGTGWQRSANGDPEWLSRRDRRRWIAAGRPPLSGKGGDSPLGTNDQDGPSPMAAPPSGADLRGKTSREAFSAVRDALRNVYTTQAQRAALFDALARIPDVRMTGAAVDRERRKGIGFYYDDDENHFRTSIVVDPETHALLGERDTTLPGYWAGYKPGTLIGWSVIDRVEVVNRIKERPE